MKPAFFKKPAAWRAWLQKHHAAKSELLVGFYKIGSGRPSLTWPESVDEALCYGWIDGVRRSLDELSYCIRFTPRKKTSLWSAVNLAKVEALIASGKMQPSGLAIHAARSEKNSGRYAFEQAEVTFDTVSEKHFRSNKEAWGYFQAQAPSYRKTCTWWVINVKQERTRVSRLERLIEASQAKERLR